MKFFYKEIELEVAKKIYTQKDAKIKENIFIGVQFKDHKGQIVKITKELLGRENGNEELLSRPNEATDACGVSTENSSKWIFVGGPIKGSYVIKSNEDRSSDYISHFGMRVADPCRIIDNNLKVYLYPRKGSKKDLRNHDDYDSTFWLKSVCQ